jgi:tRNA(His) guanylyltransferase
MVSTLGNRQKAYEEAYDAKIIRRLPVIVRVDGKNFSRVTRRLPRPYCPRLMWLMASTMLSTVKYIEGCVFAYQQSDEITFVLRNDQTLDTEPWYGNRVQKISSISSALVTYHFHETLNAMDEKPDLLGPAIFDARVFAVPSINEVVNNLIFRQQDCIRNSVTAAAQAELGRRFGRKTAMSMLQEKTVQDRIDLLEKRCEINFHEYYPERFRFGIGTYRVPKIVQTPSGQVTRQRWALDMELPEFVTNRDFLVTILNSGSDIFRAERDLEGTEIDDNTTSTIP